MKMVVLQLTNDSLKLTPVNKIAAKCIYGMPVSFVLPQALQQGEALNRIPQLAAFTKGCMCSAGHMKNKSNLILPQILLCLENDKLTTKEYQHLPTKKANVQSFVNLEAEAVLQDSVKDYVIENFEYNKLDARTGKLKGMLYAVHSQLIYDIRKEFKRCSMNVVKIIPPINGLVNATKTLLRLNSFSQKYQEKTFAMIDVGFEKIRMVMFSKNVLIFEKTFEPIFHDIVQIISKERMLSYEETEKLIFQNGIDDAFPESPTSEESKHQLKLLLETTSSEIVRNMRVVLSSERLDLENIIFCGAFSSQPNFNDFINDLALDTPFENVEVYTKNNITLSQQAVQLGCHTADFFSLNGLITSRAEETIDFLRPVINASIDRAAKISVMSVMTVLALFVMIIPVYLLHNAQVQNDTDQAKLTNPSYTEPLAQLEKQKNLKSQISAAEKNKEALPYGKSKTNQILTQVLTNLAPKVLNISSCVIDNTAGTVTLNFTTASFNDYLTFRKYVTSTGYFTIQTPFSVTSSDTGICTCSVTLGIKNFTPYPPKSAEKGASSK